VLSVVVLVSLTPTTVVSAPNKRKIVMDALRLSIWDHRKQICFMSGRSMVSRRDSIRGGGLKKGGRYVVVEMRGLGGGWGGGMH